jgi:hypothetical protein
MDGLPSDVVFVVSPLVLSRVVSVPKIACSAADGGAGSVFDGASSRLTGGMTGILDRSNSRLCS